MQIITASEQETREYATKLAQELAEQLRAGAIQAPVILALYGDLGAGKTTFVQGLALGLGIDAQLTSPTFTIVRRYDIPDAPDAQEQGNASELTSLYHMDCYRLDENTDLEALSFHDMIADTHSIVAIEWPERIGYKELASAIRITFEESGDNTRTITISELE